MWASLVPSSRRYHREPLIGWSTARLWQIAARAARDTRERHDPKFEVQGSTFRKPRTSDREPSLVPYARRFLLPLLHIRIMWAKENGMALSGHVVGLLKEYMRDLVEQAKQETAAHASFGFSDAPYRADQALLDLLAILDDRIESEGVQVGLPDGFLHQMWGLCNDARAQVTERVWLDMNSSDQPSSKARVRELTYRALLAVIETSG